MAVRVEGLRELNRAFTKAGGDVEDLKDVNAGISDLIATTARAEAPHLTGATQASVKGNRAKGKAVVKAGGARVPWAAPIHWGWPARNIEPDMFLSEAVEQNSEQILTQYEDGIDKALRKNGLK